MQTNIAQFFFVVQYIKIEKFVTFAFAKKFQGKSRYVFFVLFENSRLCRQS